MRRNAVLAIYSTFANFPDLIPDAPEVVYNYLVRAVVGSGLPVRVRAL